VAEVSKKTSISETEHLRKSIYQGEREAASLKRLGTGLLKGNGYLC
jgi:hypothetical protein